MPPITIYEYVNMCICVYIYIYIYMVCLGEEPPALQPELEVGEVLRVLRVVVVLVGGHHHLPQDGELHA